MEPSRAHSRLAEDPRLSKIITLSPASNLEEFAKSYRETKGAKAGFDVVHVSLWRNQGWADTLATLQTALGLLNANGSAVLFCNVRIACCGSHVLYVGVRLTWVWSARWCRALMASSSSALVSLIDLVPPHPAPLPRARNRLRR